AEAVFEREVGARVGIDRLRVDLAQPRHHALVLAPERADRLEHLLGVAALREEELEHRLVADLVGRLGLGGEPVVECPLARGGQAVLGPGAPAGRLGPAPDQSALLEPLELRIDLAVAGGPEKARRDVHDLLDLVPGALAEPQHPEDDAAGGSQILCARLHMPSRYIAPAYGGCDIDHFPLAPARAVGFLTVRARPSRALRPPSAPACASTRRGSAR